MARSFQTIQSACHLDIPCTSTEVHNVQVEQDNPKCKTNILVVKPELSNIVQPSLSVVAPSNTIGNTPKSVVNLFGKFLTRNELKEIHSYREIYFVGRAADLENKLKVSSSYDDDCGFYSSPEHDHIAYRYEIIKELGRGTLGNVIKAYDHKMSMFVAIKMIRNDNICTTIGRQEVTILEHLRKLDKNRGFNIVHIFDHFFFRKHLCIVMELLHINLAEALKLNDYRGFDVHTLRYFTHSILQSLNGLSKVNIVHGDLKPENIMLTNKGSIKVKIVDFGCSFFVNTVPVVGTNIQSLFYRAPEVILCMSYGMPIDMWSMGCTLSELVTGCPLFVGNDNNDQLISIMEMRGFPPTRMLSEARFDKLFVNCLDRKVYLKETTLSNDVIVLKSVTSSSREPPGSKSLQKEVSCTEPLIVDFIEQCLEWEPSKRITPERALQHPWMKNFNMEKQINETKKALNNLDPSGYSTKSCHGLIDVSSKWKRKQVEPKHFHSKSLSGLM